MSVNSELTGRRYEAPYPFLVGRAEISDFADAVGASDAAHRDLDAARAAGHADLVAPPTFAVRLTQRVDALLVTDPEAGIDFSRVVHGQQDFTHHRPIVAGDELRGVLHVDSVREAGGHAMVTTRVELEAAGGEPVCTATSMIVVRGEEEQA